MKFRVPHTYVIIFALLVLCAVATWFVPGGQYVQLPEGLSYEVVPSVPQSWMHIAAPSAIHLAGCSLGMPKGSSGPMPVSRETFSIYRLVLFSLGGAQREIIALMVNSLYV